MVLSPYHASRLLALALVVASALAGGCASRSKGAATPSCRGDAADGVEASARTAETKQESEVPQCK
jgi:hypothetical protein